MRALFRHLTGVYEYIKVTQSHTPVLCSFISGFRRISSSLRWRTTSSSYTTIVRSQTPNISSAAAVSRSLINFLKLSTADIFNKLSLNLFGFNLDTLSPVRPLSKLNRFLSCLSCLLFIRLYIRDNHTNIERGRVSSTQAGSDKWHAIEARKKAN